MSPPADLPRPDDFDTTHWSVVLQAANRGSSESAEAMATLCETYWYPLYAYVRRRVDNVDEAQDLTQEFFARLLEKDFLRAVSPQRGKFRAFLLTAIKHFLVNEWVKSKTQKRGGGKPVLSLDFQAGESRFAREPSHHMSPERLYDRQWAHTVIQLALDRLRDEYRRNGAAAQFEHLHTFIGGAADSYDIASRALGMTAGAVRVAVHRMRQRYKECLRVELAQTVSNPNEIDDEVHSLFEAVGP